MVLLVLAPMCGLWAEQVGSECGTRKSEPSASRYQAKVSLAPGTTALRHMSTGPDTHTP